MLPFKTKLPPLQKPLGNVVIDWSNPLTNGLVAAILVDGRIYHNVVNGGTQIAASPMSFGVRHDVVGGELAGAADGGVGLTFSPVGLGTLTLVEISHRLESNRYRCSVGLATDTAHNNTVPQIFFTGSDVLMYDATAATNYFGVQTHKQDQKSVRAFGIASGVPTDFYVDGVFKGSYAGAFTGISDLRSVVFGRGRGYTSVANIYESALVYNRELTEAEHKSLAADPYQIFKPAVEQVYFTAAAGGAPQVITGALAENQQEFYSSEIIPEYLITGALAENQQEFYSSEIIPEYLITGALAENQQEFYSSSFVQVGVPQVITGTLAENQQEFYSGTFTIIVGGIGRIAVASKSSNRGRVANQQKAGRVVSVQ